MDGPALREEKAMQNIHVKRYQPELKEWQGTISPEDGSWIVFVDSAGEPFFYRRGNVEKADGKLEEIYVDVELPCALPVPEGGIPPKDLRHHTEDPIDYHVEPNNDPKHPEEKFIAHLNVRAVAATGRTEHEAVRRLLNYVAQLCTSGSLDHTGAPSYGNKRRYEYVWGKGSLDSKGP